MPALTLAWEYLTGYSVAAVLKDGPAEWPPHPGRVFMALAAAWFETAPATGGERRAHEEEGAALRWLESLDEPELWLPRCHMDAERSLVTVYVPINDSAGPSTATLQSIPTLTRKRQARKFPCIYVGDFPCTLHWPNTDRVEDHGEALARVCDKVTRIGHPSSLVRMWLVEASERADLAHLERWHPTIEGEGFPCRRMSAGLLDTLRSQTQISRIEEFADLVWRIEDAENAAKVIAQRGDAVEKKVAKANLKQAKVNYEHVYGEAFKKSATPPNRLRPHIGLSSHYRTADIGPVDTDIPGSLFDTDLMVLTHAEGPALPLSATLAVVNALRDVIMKASGIQPVPSWVSGHKADGSPNDGAAGHMAMLPLPFVGREHADGHLMGMAIAFPRSIERSERGRVVGPLLVDEHGEPKDVRLTLGTLGVWALRKRDWSEARSTLNPETWTANPAGHAMWASVTPVVLDKFPKANREDAGQRIAWEQEVRSIIAAACTRVGLPHPIHIEVGTTSWHTGSPRAIGKRRRLRGRDAAEFPGGAPLGDGFPSYPSKGTKAPRPQVHVRLQFPIPVCGPVLLGAGRYRGYGVLKPWNSFR